MKKEKTSSQSEILHGYIMKCNYVFAIGIALFMALLLANHFFSMASEKQIEDIAYLNQFKMGSKNLTIAASSYAASGKKNYKEDYFKELNEDRNREKAIEGLSNNNLKDYELRELERIVKLSQDLVPNEEMAFEMIEKGRKDDAKSMMFSGFYSSSIKDISDSTDYLIEEIVTRLERQKDIIRIVQIVSEVFFAGALLWLMITIIITIRFARTEILAPVVKVSQQLISMANGDLHEKLDLKEDDSEVGNMAKAIRTMKTNWTDMIYELSYSLEEMGKGNYVLEFNTEYVGEFVTLKESLLEIVEGMREMIRTISVATNDIDAGASGLTQASETLADGCMAQATEVSDIIFYLHGINETTTANMKDAMEAVKISYLSRSTVDLEEERINTLQSTIEDVAYCIEAMSNILELTALNDETQALIDNTLSKLSLTFENSKTAITELEDIKLGTEEMTQRVERIVDNFKEELDNIAKISESLDAFASVVDNNSATAEETAAISTQQKSQVSNLVALIDKFNI